jgi:hypothetical protein
VQCLFGSVTESSSGCPEARSAVTSRRASRHPRVNDECPAVLDTESRVNYLPRAGKLVVHELAHVYGIDHCIHYHCVMNGTGHLVEEFSAPAHLCAVCLRKLQFRGFRCATVVPAPAERLQGGRTRQGGTLGGETFDQIVLPAGDPSIASICGDYLSACDCSVRKK